MRHRIFNEDGDEELVFVMGWGNRWTHENVSWLVGQLTEAGYRVHAFELPTNIDDFKADWLEPVAEYVRDLEEYQLLGHSAGALVARTGPRRRADNHVYLGPWWGYGEGFPEPLLEAVAKLPTTFPCLPRRRHGSNGARLEGHRPPDRDDAVVGLPGVRSGNPPRAG